jgi:hypothetical protein
MALEKAHGEDQKNCQAAHGEEKSAGAMDVLSGGKERFLGRFWK